MPLTCLCLCLCPRTCSPTQSLQRDPASRPLLIGTDYFLIRAASGAQALTQTNGRRSSIQLESQSESCTWSHSRSRRRRWDMGWQGTSSGTEWKVLIANAGNQVGRSNGHTNRTDRTECGLVGVVGECSTSVCVDVGEWCVSVFNVKAIWANLSLSLSLSSLLSKCPPLAGINSLVITRPEVSIIIPMLLCN